MKKIISAFLIIAVLVAGLLGCNAKKEEVSRTTQIPENGKITKDVFESIKADDDIGIFNGSNADMTYQWLFMGSLITEPKDENLLVNFSNAKTDEIKGKLATKYVQEFSLGSKEGLSGEPTLSIYFACPWDVDSVEIYQYATNESTPVLIGTAALENSPNAIVTFIPKEYKGLFYIVGKTLGADTEATEGDNANASNGKNRENSESRDNTKQGNATTTTKQSGNREGGKDKYLTDPTPEGKPAPVEPENVTVNPEKQYTATLSIRCDTILDNMDKFNQDKLSVLPENGTIMSTRTVVFSEGESVFDVLKRETEGSKIHMEFVFTPMYNSVYIEGIHNLYEFDCGELSGWMYKVNGWFPNYGCSRYVLKNGDTIEWLYTCDLGRDIGGFNAVGE